MPNSSPGCLARLKWQKLLNAKGNALSCRAFPSCRLQRKRRLRRFIHTLCRGAFVRGISPSADGDEGFAPRPHQRGCAGPAFQFCAARKIVKNFINKLSTSEIFQGAFSCILKFYIPVSPERAIPSVKFFCRQM